MTRDEWIEQGVKAGYVSPPFCDTHEGWNTDYLSQESIEELEGGGDPCVVVMMVIDK